VFFVPCADRLESRRKRAGRVLSDADSALHTGFLGVQSKTCFQNSHISPLSKFIHIITHYIWKLIKKKN